VSVLRCLTVRWVKRILVFLLLVVLGLAAFAVFTVRNSFPQTRGQLEVAGLVSTVEVHRDELGVPHIYANNQHDLFFAQGYTHAQDRFWQMDFWRHIGAGRLSEMFGADQVDTDRFLRSLGFEDLASQELTMITPRSRDILQSYADGVNAYLDSHSGSEISLEYALLPLLNSEYQIEAWSPVHSLMWAKVMAWDLSGNMGAEIARTVLGQSLTADQVEQLFPPMPADKPVIVEDGQQVASAERAPILTGDPTRAVAAIADSVFAIWEATGGGFAGIGSNNWVVSGEMTESGLPRRAADSPDGCSYNAVGFSFAGLPSVVIGHNEHIAWGVTNEAADTQDLFIERVNPDNPLQYEVEGEWVDFEVTTETLEVAGSEDVTYEVLHSRHGPIISGTYLDEGEFDGTAAADLPNDYVVALAWTALEPSTVVDAFVGINLASTHDEFSAAVELWDIAPQNLIYADVEGNIAYHATGDIPIRGSGDGRYPVPGWTSEYDWTGFVPKDEMPAMFNPPQGYIESANQNVLRPGSIPLIGSDAAHGYRAQRISEMLTSDSAHTVDSMQALQFDARDGSAEFIVPQLLVVDDAGNETIADIKVQLEAWSTGNGAFHADARSSGAAVYMAVWRNVLANTFHDELPEDHWPVGGSRWFEVVRSIIGQQDNAWWDDVSTEATETRDDILHQSMLDAHDELADLLGDEVGDWSWGALHVAEFENQTFGTSGIGPIEWLFNRTAPPRVGGSSALVNAVGWDTDKSYRVDWIPSQRMVVDMSDLDASTFVHSTGQSGHAFHPNYDSMIEMWTDGEHGPMPWSPGAVEEVTVDTLTIVPAR
jgi:penicillin amidase